MSLLRARLPWIIGYAVTAVLLIVLGVLFHRLLLMGLLLIVLALVLAIVHLILELRGGRDDAADEIERTITTQADADIERSTPGQLSEMQRLKEELLAAIAQLKASSRRGGADALAKLPWYMVLGPAQAGKSEIIKRSGLEFPLREATGEARAVRGVGGTRGFSWWLSNEAVLLDMAGKTLATAAFDDSGDWVAFLETLRRQRPEKPIHGALVVVSIDQIADQPEARVDSIARATRERLQELVEHLGVVFPVYVLFNRVDRVAGFAEFFEHLAPVERRQPWGATLSMERSRATSAEQLFDEEFGVLMASLSERRIGRMGAMPDAGARARAFAFPLQFERVRGSMRRYLRTLFEPQAEAEQPLLRGFYLTAAAPSGEPADRVLQPAVRSLGLTLRAPETVTAATGDAWFVRDLFTDVVFPDAALATTSLGARGRLRRGGLIQLAAWGLAFVVMSALFAGFSCSNGRVLARARTASVEVAERVTDGNALVENLRILDRLRESADEVDRIHRRVPFGRRLGAWSGGAVRDPAVRLWMRRMNRFVIGPAITRLEEQLRARAGGAPGTFLEDYYRFRAWRLLTDPAKIEAEDAPVLTREIRASLEDQLALGGTDAAGRDAYPELVRRQMEFLARNPRDLAAVVREETSAPDRALIAGMATVVHDTWDSRAFYDEMIAAATPRAKPLRVEDLSGGSNLLSGSAVVAGPFTLEGWTREVAPAAGWYGRLVKRDALMTETFGGRAPDLERDLLGHYAADVTQQWVGLFDSIEYRQQSTMGGTADQLARLARGDSPALKLLREARDQIHGMTVAGTPLEALANDFLLLNDLFAPPGSLGERTKDFLGDLTRRLPGLGGAPSTVKESMDAQYLRVLARAQADVKKVGTGAPLTEMQALLSPPPDQSNGVFELVGFAQGLGDQYAGTAAGTAIARVLRAPVDAARDVLRRRGLGPRVAQAWSGMFLQRFQQDLGTRYPFADSQEDASPEAVAACFGPQGYFWAFFAEHLAPFMNEDGSAKSGDAPPVSPAMVEFVRRAHTIRQAFFASGPQPALTFSVRGRQPEYQGILVRWVAFDCGGETVTYTMGAEAESPVHWSGSDPSAGGAGIRAQAAPVQQGKKRKKGEPETLAVMPLSGQGVWGLFRLIDQAASTSGGGGVTVATWRLRAADGSVISVPWELRVTSGDSPFARGFLRLSPPATP
jgi:type VI secretion system protein ImpL